MAFNFKVAYTLDRSKIEPALNSGIIDEGDLIIINESGIGAFGFITNDRQIIYSDRGTVDLSSLTLPQVGGDGKYITIIEQNDGLVSAVAKALEESEIPELSINKIKDLQEKLQTIPVIEAITNLELEAILV